MMQGHLGENIYLDLCYNRSSINGVRVQSFKLKYYHKLTILFVLTWICIIATESGAYLVQIIFSHAEWTL
jgi:hypothetical protein